MGVDVGGTADGADGAVAEGASGVADMGANGGFVEDGGVWDGDWFEVGLMTKLIRRTASGFKQRQTLPREAGMMQRQRPRGV